MAKKSAYGATINVGGQNISADVETYDISIKKNLGSASGFGEPEVFVQGQEMHEINLDVWFNASGTNSAFTALRNAFASPTGTAVTIQPAVNELTYGGNVLWSLENFNPQGDSKGDAVKLGKVKFKQAVMQTNAVPTWS